MKTTISAKLTVLILLFVAIAPSAGCSIFNKKDYYENALDDYSTKSSIPGVNIHIDTVESEYHEAVSTDAIGAAHITFTISFSNKLCNKDAIMRGTF